MKHYRNLFGISTLVACLASGCATTPLKDMISSAERAERKGNYKEANRVYEEARREIDYKIASTNLDDLKKSVKLDEELINSRIDKVHKMFDGNPIGLIAYPFIDPVGTFLTISTAKDLVEKKEEIKEYEKILEDYKRE